MSTETDGFNQTYEKWEAARKATGITTGQQLDPAALGEAVHRLVADLGRDPNQVTSIVIQGNKVSVTEVLPPIDGFASEIRTSHRFTSPAS